MVIPILSYISSFPSGSPSSLKDNWFKVTPQYCYWFPLLWPNSVCVIGDEAPTQFLLTFLIGVPIKSLLIVEYVGGIS